MASPSESSSAESGRTLSVRSSFLAMMGVCTATMMVAVDQTVVGTALPSIVAELNGFSLYAWVATAYFLTCVITVPIFGRLGDYYGRKPFIVASILVFILASVLCGFAQTMPQLVVARGLQGVGGGMLVGTAFACMPDLFPEPRVRLRWQVLLSSSFGIANAMGPTVGGLLTQYAGWRWIFFINPPIGLISLIFIWRYLPRIRQNQLQDIRLDWLGALLIALSLCSLQLLVELLPTYGADVSMLLLACLLALLVTALIMWEGRCPAPLLPLEMLRHRSLAVLFTLSLCAGFVMFTLLFYTPLLLQGGFGATPREAGLAITPLVVCITVGSLINGRLVVRVPRPNYMLYTGLSLLMISCVGLMWMGRATPGWMVAVIMVLGGLGLGLVMPNLTIFSQQLAGRSLLGIATGTQQSARMVGGMIGTALVGAIVTHLYVSRVHAALDDGPAASWVNLLEDPQTLVSQAAQSDFVQRVQRMGLHGDVFIDQARDALTGAIQYGLAATCVVILFALYWLHKLPPIRLARIEASLGRDDEQA